MIYLLTNGIIITEEALLEGYDLLVQDGRIARIAPKGEIAEVNGLEIIDAAGGT